LTTKDLGFIIAVRINHESTLNRKEEDRTMTTLVRWDPFREVAVMQNQLSRLLTGSFESAGNGSQSWVPTLDAWETDDELVYAFDLPGVPQDKISVEVEDGTLTVSAERERSQEVSEESYHRFERRFGSFARTVGLPQGITEDAINAAYKNGVLEIHVPKPEQVKPKKIQIANGGAETQTIEGTKA
jgi:HSP20 family protein